jgi:3-isopropylmalate/(R)-2-methylmalate dehydratase small subunit
VLELNGINMVIAPNFARIFRQNMYNCGMIACELPAGGIDVLFRDFADRETVLSVDPAGGTLTFREASGSALEKSFSFNPGVFEKALVAAGGWVNYAEQRY